MAAVRGMLSTDQLTELVGSGEVETVIVAFSDHYGRLCGKRYDAEFFCEEIAGGGTHGCDYLLTTDMEMEPVPGYRFANWELGYGDMHLVPDFGTLRLATWLDRTALVLCDVEDDQAHERVAVAYWGGTVSVLEGGAVKTTQAFPYDVADLTWSGERLVVGLADGRVFGLELK